MPPPLAKMLRSEKPLVRRGVAVKDTRAPTRKVVRLSRQRQEELVERYGAGALRRELADAYRIALGTVTEILKRHDAGRRTALSDEQVDQAVDGYEAGKSLAALGRELGVDANTVRSRPTKRGWRCGTPEDGSERRGCRQRAARGTQAARFDRPWTGGYTFSSFPKLLYPHARRRAGRGPHFPDRGAQFIDLSGTIFHQASQLVQTEDDDRDLYAASEPENCGSGVGGL